MPDEKTRLVALFAHEGKWCKEAEARNADGAPVTFDADKAVAWDITGALCRLFGWQRACALFEQMSRHIVGYQRSAGWPRPDPAIDAMPVWQGTSSDSGVLRKR